MCTSYDSNNKTIRLSHDGSIFSYNVSNGSKNEYLSYWSMENMKIGASTESGFEGKITLLHVWDYVIDDIENINLDDNSSTGNIFNWNLAIIRVYGSTVKDDINESQIRNLIHGIKLLPFPTSFARAKIDCKRLGGKLVQFKNISQTIKIKNLCEKKSLCNQFVWSAYTKRSNGLFQ